MTGGGFVVRKAESVSRLHTDLWDFCKAQELDTKPVPGMVNLYSTSLLPAVNGQLYNCEVYRTLRYRATLRLLENETELSSDGNAVSCLLLLDPFIEAPDEPKNKYKVEVILDTKHDHVKLRANPLSPNRYTKPVDYLLGTGYLGHIWGKVLSAFDQFAAEVGEYAGLRPLFDNAAAPFYSTVDPTGRDLMALTFKSRSTIVRLNVAFKTDSNVFLLLQHQCAKVDQPNCVRMTYALTEGRFKQLWPRLRAVSNLMRIVDRKKRILAPVSVYQTVAQRFAIKHDINATEWDDSEYWSWDLLFIWKSCWLMFHEDVSTINLLDGSDRTIAGVVDDRALSELRALAEKFYPMDDKQLEAWLIDCVEGPGGGPIPADHLHLGLGVAAAPASSTTVTAADAAPAAVVAIADQPASAIIDTPPQERDVRYWLASFGLDKYYQQFVDHELDGDPKLLADLTEPDFPHLGITLLGERLRLRRMVNHVKQYYGL